MYEHRVGGYIARLKCVGARLAEEMEKKRRVELYGGKRELQCVAACCSVLQCVAVCCSALQCAAVCCSVLQCVAVCCSVLQCVAVCFSVLQ